MAGITVRLSAASKDAVTDCSASHRAGDESLRTPWLDVALGLLLSKEGAGAGFMTPNATLREKKKHVFLLRALQLGVWVVHDDCLEEDGSPRGHTGAHSSSTAAAEGDPFFFLQFRRGRDVRSTSCLTGAFPTIRATLPARE